MAEVGQESVAMHNDEPTLLDSLGRKMLIEEVGEAIASCTPPQVFGVHGDWGLGKTSFLHQVQWYLTGDCPQQSEAAMKAVIENPDTSQYVKGRHEKTIRAVWFDAWRYQHDDAPVVALLQEMRAQLSWGHQVAGALGRGTGVTVRGALLSLEELTKKIGFQYSKFRDANREWEVKNLAVSLPSHTLREHLHKAIDELLPKQKKGAPQPRLAVFIDDVDRCEPESAYLLLEGLKIYLTLDNCVFILGMNQKAVEDAIGSRAGMRSEEIPSDQGTKLPAEAAAAYQRTKSRAAAYMEKLCQNVWRLPAVQDPGKVLHGLLKKTVESESIRELISDAVKDSRCLPPNPRRIKGLANLIGRLADNLPAGLERGAAIIEAQILVIVAYIYQFHADIYVRWEAELDLYDKIFDRCGGATLNIPFLDSLVLPTRKGRKDTAPKPPTENESTYPDPTDTNVFWIQPLILRLGTEVTADQFKPYLHGRTT